MKDSDADTKDIKKNDFKQRIHSKDNRNLKKQV
jgi:hypothetical protein